MVNFPRDMESCHLVAERRVKPWLLNANLFFEEPRQLTTYMQRSPIYSDLGVLLGMFSPKQSWCPPLFYMYISDVTNSSSYHDKIFRNNFLETVSYNELGVLFAFQGPFAYLLKVLKLLSCILRMQFARKLYIP